MNSLKPFMGAPGRDVTKDMPGVDVARYYYDQRATIGEDSALLSKLIAAVDSTNELTPPQWAQWYSVALGFAPDLILELGRARGNSTAVFTQAAARLPGTRVVSLCQSSEWMSAVAPRIAKLVGPSWFHPLDARLADIITSDFGSILGAARRVLVLWDAHGFEMAETVFGDILPRLQNRDHLLLLHDISDNRYAHVSRSYEGQPLWKGAKWQEVTGAWKTRVNIGWMHSIQDQVIALADFSARNDLEICSADHEYARFFGDRPDRMAEMRATIGDALFSTIAHWAFLSLTGKSGPFYFPAVLAQRPLSHRSDITIKDVSRRRPVTFRTDAKAWAYAVTWTWSPVTDVPAAVHPVLCVRLRSDPGAVGVSLLDREGRRFVGSKVAAAAADSTIVRIPVDDLANRGQIVIHTWDAPVSSTVHVEDVWLAW